MEQTRRILFSVFCYTSMIVLIVKLVILIVDVAKLFRIVPGRRL